jgi:hypothetical protein
MAYVPYVQRRCDEGVPRQTAAMRQDRDEPNVDQPPQDQNDPRFIARRLFKELCALYPDRYIALIEQPPLLSTELATAKVPAAPQKPTL